MLKTLLRQHLVHTSGSDQDYAPGPGLPLKALASFPRVAATRGEFQTLVLRLTLKEFASRLFCHR